MWRLIKKILGRRGGAKSASDEPPSSAAGAKPASDIRADSSERRFRLLVEGVREYAIIMLDPSGRVVSWNLGAERISGWTAGEIVGHSFERFYLEEEAAAGRPQRELELATSLGKYEEEGWRRRKDGTRFWASVVVTSLRDEDGVLQGFAKITRDMTERKLAEENSRRLLQEEAARQAAEAGEREAQRAHREEHRQREQLRVTLASIGDGVIVTDVQGNVTFLNPVAAQLTGWTTEQAEGMPVTSVFRIVNEHTRAEVENPVTRVLREGQTVGLANHTILISRHGTELPIDDSGAPIRTPDGEIQGAVLVFRDVTEARRAAEIKQHVASIVESSDEAIISKNLEGIVVSWNRGAERLYGYTAEEMIGRPIAAILPPDQPDELPSLMQRLQSGERIERFQTRRLRKDGTALDVSITVSPVRDESGRVVGASKIARDVTAQRRSEASLRVLADAGAVLSTLGDPEASLQQLARLVVPALADRCVVDLTDAEGELRRRVSVAAQAASEAELDDAFPLSREAGHGPGAVRRTGRSQLLAPKDTPLVPGRVTSTLSVPLVARDKLLGVLSMADVESRRRLGPDDLRLAEDLAGRAAAALDNARLYAELKEADRRKDEFLAMLAHELRNPLAPIRTSLEAMLQSRDARAMAASRDIIERQVGHLARLVDDLLDVSRIMRGRIELRREPVEVGGVIAAAVETAKPLADGRGQEILVSAGSEPAWLQADSTRLAQVFSNLLHNASKFSMQGGRIWLTAQRDRMDLVVTVRDEGIGIAPALLPHVFDLFTQGDSSLERARGGMGIGLTIVRRLVNLHGGSVTVSSPGQGKGATVTVRLPLLEAHPVAESRREAGAGAAAETRRVLIVDDNSDAVESSALLLRAWGHDVRVAGDGPEAIRVAGEMNPDVVLLDIGLPGMSGLDVARHLRRQNGSRNAVIVAVTGYGQEQDRRRTHEAGFDRHLTKPVDPGVLRTLIASAPTLRGA